MLLKRTCLRLTRSRRFTRTRAPNAKNSKMQKCQATAHTLLGGLTDETHDQEKSADREAGQEQHARENEASWEQSIAQRRLSQALPNGRQA